MSVAQTVLKPGIESNYPINDNFIRFALNSTTLARNNDWNEVRPGMNRITGGGYEAMAREITTRLIECSVDNWGGNHECAVDAVAAGNAELFINYAKHELDWFPAISVSDDGQIMLEWTGDKYVSYISINKFGLIFVKTHKNQIGGDEDNKTLTFADKTDADLRNSLWKIFKSINDKDNI